jgi:Kef-type K+ transport system membrane component KefB
LELHLLSVQIPFTEPVLIIALIMTIILIGPVLFERIRIPSIVGLLLSGALIGGNGFNLVPNDLEFTLLSTMGLLYLMFLAGLEIDLIDFIENKFKSIFIGVASFLIPFLLGFVVSRYLLGYNVFASWLIGAMLSSHTLISYPLMGRLGIISKSIVTIVVGATIIADVLALVAMELIINFAGEGVEIDNFLHLLLSFVVFFLFIFLVIPRLSRSFLSLYEGELGVQYIFVMFILFVAAVVAHLLDIEPILGAFFSGLVLNRQIINSSPLYKRIEFIGNNLFIPFFLISIGMLSNFRVYIDDPVQIGLLVLLITVAIVSKYLPALFSRLVFKLSGAEMNLIFGMSVSRAASAVAIILIGFNNGLISESFLNNTVMLILTTSILSTYVTQLAGKKIQMTENDTVSGLKRPTQKILVPLANPDSMAHLLEFAVLIKQEEDLVPIYPLTVFTQRNEASRRIDENREQIMKVIDTLNTDLEFEASSRIDNNVTNGITRAAEEMVATAIIMGWNNAATPLYKLFGNKLLNLLQKTRRMVLVLKTPSDFRSIRKIHLFYPRNAQYEDGFALWLVTVIHLVRKLQIKIVLYCAHDKTREGVLARAKSKNAAKYFEVVRDFSGELT